MLCAIPLRHQIADHRQRQNVEDFDKPGDWSARVKISSTRTRPITRRKTMIASGHPWLSGSADVTTSRWAEASSTWSRSWTGSAEGVWRGGYRSSADADFCVTALGDPPLRQTGISSSDQGSRYTSFGLHQHPQGRRHPYVAAEWKTSSSNGCGDR